MVYAQVTAGVIVNTIIINDVSLLPLFQVNRVTGIPYDMVVQVDQLYPQPGIGWTFDNIRFQPPPQSTNQDPPTGTVQLSATSTDTITAPTSIAVMSGMSLVPGAGSYVVLFSCDVSSSVAGASITVSLYTNGVPVSGGSRSLIPYSGGLLATPPGTDSVSINQSIIVGDGDTVEIWWSTSSTGPTTASRTLSIFNPGR